MVVLPRGELQNCGDVLCFEIRIIRKDLVTRGAGGEELEHVFHTDTKTTDARATPTDVRRHRDSIKRTHP